MEMRLRPTVGRYQGHRGAFAHGLGGHPFGTVAVRAPHSVNTTSAAAEENHGSRHHRWVNRERRKKEEREAGVENTVS